MFDEMQGPSGTRPEYAQIARWIAEDGVEALMQRREEAEALFRKVGITFAVYGEGGDPERLIPFDMIPRIFAATEWNVVERGCIQRCRALNAFLADIYAGQDILRAGIIPEELVTQNDAFEKEMIGVKPAGDVLGAYLRGRCGAHRV